MRRLSMCVDVIMGIGMTACDERRGNDTSELLKRFSIVTGCS